MSCICLSVHPSVFRVSVCLCMCPLLHDIHNSPMLLCQCCHCLSPVQVVQRSRTYRKESRKEAVREYFYGKLGGTAYFPYSFDVAFSEVQLYKIGGNRV